uniref:heterodimeric geranylgeranyl pyrophosphate synthase small subunit, chloroplastic-like n=1 Tax=Erigeron canadensis TaxID=72917 RepID=UPI001CB99B59|nr:heterodimeric geranylgeranyl pyrophosphate synthase small subunit, chloroplastic-like [Erigeron canadensis]
MAGAHISLSKINLSRPSTFAASSAYGRRPIIASVTQNLSYLDSIHYDIDSNLKKAIPSHGPISVLEPMHHLTFTPPKSNASALCIAACELVGGDRDDAIVAASSIHLMHAAIHSREHLLLTGRVKTKLEPEPKIPYKFGSDIELLTGNGIMSFGFELLAGSKNLTSKNSNKILRVIIEITRAIGSQGMVHDQDYETEYDQPPSRQLHGCGAMCGAILGGGNEEEIERLKRYGVYVGKIQGLLSGIGRNDGGKMQLAKKWRALAMKELEYFDSEKVEHIISSFVKFHY